MKFIVVSLRPGALPGEHSLHTREIEAPSMGAAVAEVHSLNALSGFPAFQGWRVMSVTEVCPQTRAALDDTRDFLL